MQPDRTRCTECGGEMELGFLLDTTRGGILPQRWSKNFPEGTWWGGVKVKWDQCRIVKTDRCKACGYLKSYAK